MLLAQLHRKVPSEFEGMEDVLTSSVFGLLKYLPDQLACHLLVRWADISLKQDSPQLEFWHRYPTPRGFHGLAVTTEKEDPASRGDTEPYVLIRTHDWLVLVEIKYRSPLDDAYDQLGREFTVGYRLAKQEGRHFRMLVVTAHTLPPTPAGVDLVIGLQQAIITAADGLADIVEQMVASVRNSLRWINWQQLYVTLSETSEAYNIAEHNRKLLKDVCQLLELRRLTPYDNRLVADAISRWDRAGIPGKVWASPVTYRYRTMYSLSVGWEALSRLDATTLYPLAWQLERSVPDCGLVPHLLDFKLDSLKTLIWQPYP